jgi:hypothetical protein
VSRRRRQQPTNLDYGRLAAEMIKAGMRLPSGAVATPMVNPPTQPNVMSLAQGNLAPPLAPGGWTDPLVAFGPGKPVRPAAIDPVDPLSGRPLPRRYDYPTSINLPGVEDRVVPWTLLRRLADASIVRRCIEIRKAEMVAQEWDFSVSPAALQRAISSGTQTPSDVMRSKAIATGNAGALVEQSVRQAVSARSAEQTIRAKNAQTITRLKKFWARPDRINDLTMDDWLMVMLEEHFVLDALSIYPHMNLGGKLHSLEIIDGSTIKPLLDHRGSIPQAPNPAFQQILHGFPRGEFAASTDATDEFDRDTLIYRPRYRRANSPYGMSNTEQAIVNADLYMKRIEWIRAEYTSGVIPEMFILTDTSMNPDQLLAYERVFNDYLTGQAEERHRAKVFPQGFTPTQLQNFEERYRPDYDLHLIRLVGNDFDVMPTELGFPPNGGLGGKGLSDGEENITFRKGTRPLTKWAVDTLNLISMRYLGMTTDLTFKFLGLESEDEGMAQEVLAAQFHNASITANEMRDQLGLPRYDISDADVPFIITGRDIVPLAGSTDRANAAAMAATQAPGGKPANPSAGVTTPKKPKSPDNPGSPGDNGDNTGNAFKQKSAEIAEFKTYVKNRQKTGRPWRHFDFLAAPEWTNILNKMGAREQYDGLHVVIADLLDQYDSQEEE